MIGVDWGTTNFRAFLFDAEGRVLARQSSPQGILQVENGDFAAALRAAVGDWLRDGERHVLLCGMIGSRQGWIEAPYLACPAGIEELAKGVVAVPLADETALTVRLVPGVMSADEVSVPELMRGEETAAMGVLELCGGTGVVCFPGTHNKWIRLSDHKVVTFKTCMTGEVYSALSKCTILGRTMDQSAPFDRTAFLEGLQRSADAGGLLHHLFGTRTLTLRGRLSEGASSSYLSGLLIGHDVRASMLPGTLVHLVGTPHLCELYAEVIEACEGSAVVTDEDTAAVGLAAIGRSLQWT